MNSTLKNIFIFVLIIGVLGGGYYYFVGNKAPAPALTGVDTTGSTDASAEAGVQDEFLSTLLNIKTLQLDDAIFTSTAFRSLQDFTTELVDQGNEGRANPFAPIGTDALTAPADTAAPSDVPPVAPGKAVKP